MSLSPFTGIAVSLVYTVCALGAGFPFAFPLRKQLQGIFLPCVAFTFGSGVLSTVFFFLCSAGKATQTNLHAVTVAGCVLSAVYIRRWRGTTGDVKGSLFGGAADLSGKFCAAGTLVFLIAAGIMALAPPVDVDALSYHLALPETYAAARGFIPQPSIVYSRFPLGGEMMFLYPLAVGSPIGAALVNWTVGVFLVMSVAVVGNRLSGGSCKLGNTAALLLASTPLFVWEMRSSYVDLAMGLYLFMSFSVLIQSRDEVGFAGVAMAGACAGFAVATKLTAGPCAVILMFFAGMAYRGRLATRLAAVLIFSVFCILPVAPWLIRTYCETGNPVFPFAYGLFGGIDWNPALNKEFFNWHFGYGAGRGLRELMELPYNLTFRAGGNFGWPDVRRDRELGYVFFFFLPLLFLPGRVLRERKVVATYVALALAAWFFSTQQLRFLLVLLPEACVLYAAGMVLLSKRNKMVSVAVTTCFALMLAVNLFSQAGHIKAAMKALSGGDQAKEDYISGHVASYNAYKALDRLSRAGGGGAGLLLDTSSFYSETRVVWLNPMQQGVFNYEKIGGPEELMGELRKHDVRWLLVNKQAFVHLYGRLDGERLVGRPYSEYFLKFFGLFHSMLNGRKVAPAYDDGRFVIYQLK